MTMSDPDVDLFLEASSEHGVQPAGWTRREGEGRVCVLVPGHFPNIWSHPSYQVLLRNTLNWCVLKSFCYYNQNVITLVPFQMRKPSLLSSTQSLSA